MSTSKFNSVKDIVDFAKSSYYKDTDVFIQTESVDESEFIQSELEKFGVRVGVCFDFGYPKHICVYNGFDNLRSSGHSDEGIIVDNSMSFSEFKYLVDRDSEVVVDNTVGDQIQDKLKVVEHYLNGGDIQFLGCNDKWIALTGCFVLSTIKTNDVRIKPKTYVVDGVSMEKDEILRLLGDE